LVESVHDGHATDFVFSVNLGTGEVVNCTQSLAIVYDSGSVDISRSAPTRWAIVTAEADVEDVPVARAAALIEEALNAAQEPEEEEVPELVSAAEPEVAPEADEEN
jgi:hypothetical protein